MKVLNWRGRLTEDERGIELPGSVGGEEVWLGVTPPSQGVVRGEL